jgi:hypothetical protein
MDVYSKSAVRRGDGRSDMLGNGRSQSSTRIGHFDITALFVRL